MAEMSVRYVAGIVLINKDRQVFFAERSDVPGAWQLPQGGIDEGEDPAKAAVRELFEETAISPEDVEILDEHPDWLSYRIADKDKLRHQKWFLVRYKGDGNIDLSKAQDQEFRAWVWEDADAIVRMVVEFRRSAYATMLRYFGLIA